MKKLILSAVLLPIALRSNNIDSIEIRSGKWPISMERSSGGPGGMSYLLQFRDQGVLNGEVLDTIVFENREQLKYFDQALVALKKGNNGDIARFKSYSVKRADKKGEGIWYILRDKYGLTDFQQNEADMISTTIKSW